MCDNQEQKKSSIRETAKQVAEKSRESIGKAKESVIKTLDQNGNDQIDIEDIIILGLKVPGIHIDRASFLHTEFFKNYPPDVVEDAIRYTPAHAGISVEEIDALADEVIKLERTCVSGISAALGTPGGFAMVATIPADLVQYYAYMLRVTQKLLYLYGFPEIDYKEDGQMIDSATMNTIILCMGVMYGVAGANAALKKMAQALAAGVEKKLLKTALTKGVLYPIIKNIMKWFNINLTKAIFAKTIRSAIPVVGGVLGGALTFVTFKPCCERLKKTLHDSALTDPNYFESHDEKAIIDMDSLDLTEEDCPCTEIPKKESDTDK